MYKGATGGFQWHEQQRILASAIKFTLTYQL